jgi:hypothetical protein
MLLNDMSEHFAKSNHEKYSKLFSEKAVENGERSKIIHDSIFKLERMSEDIRYDSKNL